MRQKLLLSNYIFPTQLEADLLGPFSIPKYRGTAEGNGKPCNTLVYSGKVKFVFHGAMIHLSWHFKIFLKNFYLKLFHGLEEL